MATGEDKALSGAGTGAASGAAIGGPWGAVIGGVIGGVAGLAAGDDKDDAASTLRKQALAMMQNVPNPTIEQQMIVLKQLQSVGDLTPEMEATVQQADSEMKNVSTDPRLKNQQMNALQSLIDQSSTGLNATDKAALNQIQMSNEASAHGREGQILQAMQQRGMLGSGAELAAQLSNSQAATQQGSTASLNVAAQAQQRALDALAKSGDLSTSLRTQDFNEQSAQAKAQDAINAFNAQNRQTVAQNNTNIANQAQGSNLANKQNIANQNVGLYNQQEKYNQGLYQQKFDNDIKKAGGIVTQSNTNANALNNEAAATRGMYSEIGKGVGQAAGTYMSQPAEKTSNTSSGNNNSFSGSEMKNETMYAAGGGKVPGKAKMPGDHPENDTVHAMLSPGEIVIPRSVQDEADSVIMNFIKKARSKG